MTKSEAYANQGNPVDLKELVWTVAAGGTLPSIDIHLGGEYFINIYWGAPTNPLGAHKFYGRLHHGTDVIYNISNEGVQCHRLKESLLQMVEALCRYARNDAERARVNAQITISKVRQFQADLTGIEFKV